MLTFSSYCILIVTSVVLYVYLWRENKRRDALGHISEEQRDDLAFRDLTDGENMAFRYVL